MILKKRRNKIRHFTDVSLHFFLLIPVKRFQHIHEVLSFKTFKMHISLLGKVLSRTDLSCSNYKPLCSSTLGCKMSSPRMTHAPHSVLEHLHQHQEQKFYLIIEAFLYNIVITHEKKTYLKNFFFYEDNHTFKFNNKMTSNYVLF